MKTRLSELPFVALALTVLALGIFLLPGAEKLLQYDRSAVQGGQLWRLLTGHWTHWSFDQLLWNAGALLALGAACERLGRRRFLTCVVGSGLLILLSILAFAPGVSTYRGLSGLASALFVYLAVQLIRGDRRDHGSAVHGEPIPTRSDVRRGLPRASLAGLALFGFAAKVTYEMLSGETVFVDSTAGIVVLPLAHAAGGVVGAVAALVPWPAAADAGRPPRDGVR